MIVAEGGRSVHEPERAELYRRAVAGIDGVAPVIIDSDIGYVNDDCVALLVALGISSLDVIGLTIVAGNFDRDQEVVDALSILELLGRPDIGVYRGADRPLLHRRSGYDDRSWGEWATFGQPSYPLGGPPRAQARDRTAAEFITETVRSRPGEVILVCTGPLTNVALAFSTAPDTPTMLKKLVLMGGSVPSLPNGAGNVTPTAEFNFWVDPEAARICLSANAPTLVVPLNVTRMMRYTQTFHRQVTRRAGPIGALLKTMVGGHFGDAYEDESPTRSAPADAEYYGLTDSAAVVAAARPDLFKIIPAYMAVDTGQGMAYGTSYAWVLQDESDSYRDLAELLGEHNGFIQPSTIPGCEMTDVASIALAVGMQVEDFARVSTEALLRSPVVRSQGDAAP